MPINDIKNTINIIFSIAKYINMETLDIEDVLVQMNLRFVQEKVKTFTLHRFLLTLLIQIL